MPQSYAVLDNGSGGAGSKKTQQRKYVRSYLKSKGVAPSAAGQRSKREKKLRAEGRAAFAAMGKPKSKPAPRTSGISADRRPENKAKVDRAERARQERMRPKVDREAQRQLKGRSQNKNYVRGKNR